LASPKPLTTRIGQTNEFSSETLDSFHLSWTKQFQETRWQTGLFTTAENILILGEEHQ
jgi:hypothetical protein